jgi:hypothetical protein
MKIYTIEETKCIIIDGELWVRFEEAFPDNVEEGVDEQIATPATTTRKRNGRAPKWDNHKGQTAQEPKVEKQGRKCSACGQLGHTARTCGRKEEPLMSDEEASPAFRKGGISQDQFEQVKDLQAEGQNSMAISRDTGIPLVQVGRIMNSDDYEEFLGKA